MSNYSKIFVVGGHSTPAFAVLDEVIERGYNNIVWVGEKYNQRGSNKTSAEYDTVTKDYSLKFIHLKAGKLVRKWTRKTFLGGILEMIWFILGFLKSFFIILKYRPKLILSFGGFTAVPIVFWGRIFRAKVVTHEQTVTSGLANKIISKFANKVFVSWEDTLALYPRHKTVLTGNPIRKDVFKIQSDITNNFDNTLPIIYITGGNQGAHEINRRVFEIIENLLKTANVVHQTGRSSITRDFEKAKELRKAMPESIQKRYIVKDYVGATEIGEVLNKASLVVSRSGANIVTEIIALNKPSVLIPIPWTSNDEQTKNAKMLEKLGLAIRLIQDDSLMSEDILNAINSAMSLTTSNLDKQRGSEADNLKNRNRGAAAMIATEALRLLN